MKSTPDRGRRRSLLITFQRMAERIGQMRKIVANSTDHEFHIYRPITVDKPVTHSNDLLPRNMRQA
jgi:hypothetical protein